MFCQLKQKLRTSEIDATRQQGITLANVDPDLCHHMVSLDHNELMGIFLWIQKMDGYFCVNEINFMISVGISWNRCAKSQLPIPTCSLLRWYFTHGNSLSPNFSESGSLYFPLYLVVSPPLCYTAHSPASHFMATRCLLYAGVYQPTGLLQMEIEAQLHGT